MTALVPVARTQFRLPDELTATEPAEARGLARDEVRLMVARPSGITHRRFRDLPEALRPGDLVVVNTSQTVAAQLDGVDASNGPVVVHLAIELDDGDWVIELRTAPDAARPVLLAEPGRRVVLDRQLELVLVAPYPRADGSPTGSGSRLWRARVQGTGSLSGLLATRGRPISYGYLSRRWPLSDYQTVFGNVPGSAEMPSAGRPFTDRLVTRLLTAGVAVAPILLHTGVSSQEAGEPPQAERFEVGRATAELANLTRARGNRVIAVGTTVTRALESATDAGGRVHPAAGWTDLVIGGRRPVRLVSGLITGWHNPEASHLLLVEAVAGSALAQQAYAAAVSTRYRWHEFGDSCIFLP
ncbi:S-adenosylmethionine:tRNA ribosyltransferase-isomerase [Jatrophihabitans telluris]|uniref:S-adenosylmethionine:tRNA ribosyltransferase-isomerase n=1 Tax=Jatrophihabitans telluris TaxID=2038343 RepID=A0ABY4R209_9ACTN|nr:S-adenosylmethionine:tRNA ribosyltransferase-isomerase [Jatrophihabitans telluris]UQX89834.1 S-adenosylmethionine:tRNA ribosyltransferase-isomerase [Jatrophihabitans telluris]